MNPQPIDNSIQKPSALYTHRRILFVLLVLVLLPIVVFAALNPTIFSPKATSALPIAAVKISPGEIITKPLGQEIHLSTLAYDTGGNPITAGVTYQWGMSSTNSIGTIVQEQGNGALGTFTPSANVGHGDLWVRAFAGTSQGLGSIPVSVGTNPPTPTPTPLPQTHLGPGELDNITVTSTINNSSSTTITIGGGLVASYSSLTGEIFYYISNAGRPELQSQTYTFTKNSTTFSANISVNFTCMDIKNGSTYIASICVKDNSVGRNYSDYLYSADTQEPFKYVTGQGYVWGQNNSRHRVAFKLPTYHSDGSYLQRIQSMTMPFNKNNNPYFAGENSFKPTNFLWTVQSGFSPTEIKDPDFWFGPNSDVSCSDQWAKIGIFSSIFNDISDSYKDVQFFSSDSTVECWFRTPYPYPFLDFSPINGKIVRMTKYIGPTPTSSPTPTPRPTNTPTPIPTPTPASLITILTPNGGENLIKGSQYNITWKTSPDIKSVDLGYSYYGNNFQSTTYFVHNYPNTGSYIWNVSTTYPSGTILKIRAIAYPAGVADESDDFFTYALPIPTPTPAPTATPTPIPTPTPTPTPISCNVADINRDGVVDLTDDALLVADFFKTDPTNIRSDINHDGVVDLTDYSILVAHVGQSTGPCQ